MPRRQTLSELDLEAIKNRHLRPEQMEHRTFYEGHIVIDLAALVEEVEYLRKERPAVVEWLLARAGETSTRRPGHENDVSLTYSLAADFIERGAHHCGEEP